MAEGIQVSSLNTKYFCHHCSKEVSPFNSTNLICPDCSSGFLEEVTKEFYESENILPNDESYEYETDDDDLDLTIPSFGIEHFVNHLEDSAQENRLAESDSDDADTFSLGERMREILTHSREAREEGAMWPGIFDGFDDLSYLNGFLNGFQLAVGDRIDDLQSELLDQIELSGPAPLSKQQIKSIPLMAVTQADADKGLQCTVCMDDFSVREKVKRLPCNHLYHEKCITPWLEKQASCPNCRETVEVRSERSRSYPRNGRHPPSGAANERRERSSVSEASSLGDFFTSRFRGFLN